MRKRKKKVGTSSLEANYFLCITNSAFLKLCRLLSPYAEKLMGKFLYVMSSIS